MLPISPLPYPTLPYPTLSHYTYTYTYINTGTKLETTRDITFDASAADLKEILEEDLSVGSVFVSRSNVDVYDGGYEWLVTFQGLPGSRHVPLFTSDTTKLVGTCLRPFLPVPPFSLFLLSYFALSLFLSLFLLL